MRTRALLIEAAETLALEGPEALTAARVATTAGVSRSAFYVHFDSVAELANTLLLERMSEIAEGIHRDLPGIAWEDVLWARTLEWIEQYHAHRALFLAVRRLPGVQQGVEAGMQPMVDILRELVVGRPRLPEGSDPDLIARWMAGGIFGVLHAWIDGEIEGSATEILERAMPLLPDWFLKDDEPGV